MDRCSRGGAGSERQPGRSAPPAVWLLIKPPAAFIRWLQVNPEEERLARWTTCQLSGMPLQPPCVADELGSLFNKDAVLQVRLLCCCVLL